MSEIWLTFTYLLFIITLVITILRQKLSLFIKASFLSYVESQAHKRKYLFNTHIFIITFPRTIPPIVLINTVNITCLILKNP